ncbi:lipase family protein [Nocardia ninae]|uniref:Lipase n=1 Tax=Nocardia ninae NBRC 108245 TaxID=1210091 RepID=A0A511M617_9NOCA|nr:lipase [Nocardia ninae NBRC 108245]
MIRTVIRWLLAVGIASCGLSVAGPVAHGESGDLVATQRFPADWGDGYIVTYRTEGSDGRPALARGLLMVPSGPAPAGGWPMISFDHGAGGLGPACGASASATMPVDVPYFRRLNSLGYAVVSTDYLGLSPVAEQVHPYLHARTEATATIDIVRAAREFTDSVGKSWAVFGVSQGGHAALATARLASTYAPELDFRGAAALAPGSQLEYLFPLAGPHIPRSPLLDNSIAGASVLLIAFLAGMWATDPTFDLTPYLTPAGAQVLSELRTACQDRWPTIIGGHGLGELLARPLFEEPARRAIADYVAIPADGYRQPIFLGHGTRDVAVPPLLTQALANEFALAGTEYEYRTFDTDHEGIMGPGFDAGVEFLQRILPAGR